LACIKETVNTVIFQFLMVTQLPNFIRQTATLPNFFDIFAVLISILHFSTLLKHLFIITGELL